MAITVVGGTAAEQGRVKDAADEVIVRLWRVTPGWLRTCIKTKATRGTVIIEQCEDSKLLGYNNWTMLFGHKLWAQDEIHICLNNIGANDDLLADVMLHEWAHSCCWDHGDGGGVPGNNGTLP
jgi:hypothetical protein